MPAIDTIHTAGVIERQEASAIRFAIIRFGVEHFSTSEFKLEMNHFTTTFREAGKFDVLTQDIVVRVMPLSHELSASLIDPDMLAAELAERLKGAVEETFEVRRRIKTINRAWYSKDISIGVSMPDGKGASSFAATVVSAQDKLFPLEESGAALWQDPFASNSGATYD